MNVTDVSIIVNEALDQAMGEHAVLEQDLSNVVEIGNSVLNSNSMDNFVRQLPDVVGRMVFTNQRYDGLNLSLMKDAWEYGAALVRLTTEMPTATTNEVWELQDGASYDPNVFHKPSVTAKYYQDRNAFDIEISIAKDQAKSAFHSAEELNSFIASIYLEVENAITIALDELCLYTLDVLIGYTIADEFASGNYSAGSGIRAVNALYEYNQAHRDETPLTVDNCLNDEKFLEFLAEIMSNTPKKLMHPSTLFNVGGKKRVTPKDKLRFILLDQVEKKFDIYLKSTRFHDNLVDIPGHETVPYWQGSGTTFDLNACSKINIKHDDVDIELSGILGAVFDDRAAMVCNQARDTDVNYNGKARFYNYFYHVFNGLLVDTNFSCVVYFIA